MGVSATQLWVSRGSLPEGVRIFYEGAVIEGRGMDKKAECVSKRFTYDTMAAKDPNRLAKPKGWL